MALELKIKQEKDKGETNKKKFKRTRDVFGKRLSRIGIFVLIIFEVLAFATVKVLVTKKQNDRQNKIEKNIQSILSDIAVQNAKYTSKKEELKDIGKLIATLPTSFDRQATNLDIDRMISLCGLTEDSVVTRTYDEKAALPFDSKNSTLKAVRISFTVIGDVDDIDAITDFITYLTDYKHENFYYIYSLEYLETRNVNVRSRCSFEIYTFYNDVVFS